MNNVTNVKVGGIVGFPVQQGEVLHEKDASVRVNLQYTATIFQVVVQHGVDTLQQLDVH